ncbi:hypothetical protein GU926_08180 [Nibribacter ruber]|uniref:Phage portal protein n=1 Tax=Nibribacter ruber TaxID=2698458 RepID=A0A6P1P1B3_9BACT|nr:hypothetical protein [Nibribacter ruber]QHL87413.1 hypothetical protein GU926_08180 [Nibribacter ruber]
MTVIANSSGTMFFGSNSRSVFKTGSALSAANAGSKGRDMGTPTVPTKKADGGGDIEKWGDDNKFPQNVREEAEKNTILPAVLERRAALWHAGGITYGEITGYDDAGNEIFQRTKDTAIDEFFRKTNILRYGYESFMDLSWFANSFPEFVKSRDGSQIVRLTSQEATFSRYSKANPTSGIFERLYINGNWDKSDSIDGLKSVSVLDPYDDPVAQILESGEDKFIYPISIPSPDKCAYQLASWNSVRRSGWLEVAQAIPEFKKQLFKNQLTIKYIVSVHSAYWVWKYKDWDEKSEDQRKLIIGDELETFDKVMAGTDGAGKSILTTTITLDSGETIAAFKVEAVDDKLQSGIYVEDSQEASSHILTAVGLAPVLMGITPGKSMGAGSGSDARVHFNNFISTSKFQQELVLEPLYTVRDVNGWNPNTVFRIQNPLIMTLDKGKQVQQETS